MRELKRRKDIENDRAGGEKIYHRSTFLEWYVHFVKLLIPNINNKLNFTGTTMPNCLPLRTGLVKSSIMIC